MARPLRILVAGGWYHVTSRRNRREAIFRTESDRQRFLAMVAELPERFGLEVHAFVLMDNHYHQGTEPAPAWLDTGVVGCGCGGQSREERQRALRAYTEAPIRQGRLESPWERMVGGAVLGGSEFAPIAFARSHANFVNC